METEDSLNSYACSGFTDVDGGVVCAAAEARGAEAVSAGADAGAALPVQSGLRGMREDSVSGAHFEEGSLAGGMFPGGGRVRGADGFDPGRRAADASADRGDRRGAGGAEEIYLLMHQRAAAEGKDSAVQA